MSPQPAAPFDEMDTTIAGNLPHGSKDDTFDRDVFDGIEDIYDDLEAAPPPPPPSSTNDMLHATQHMTCGGVMGIGQANCANNDEPASTPFFCGFNVPDEQPQKQKTMWEKMEGLFATQQYTEMKEEETFGKNADEILAEIKNTDVSYDSSNVDSEPSSTTEVVSPPTAHNNNVPRETVIRHTILEEEENDEKKQHPSPFARVMEKTKQVLEARSLQLLRSKETEDTTPESLPDATVIRHDVDEDINNIRKEKVNKYYPSFWEIMGQRKFYGVSYRLIFLVSLNLFAFILLIILVTRFTGKDDTRTVDSSAQNNIANNQTVVAEEDPNEQLQLLCGNDDSTVEDGVILTANQALEHGDFFCSPSKTHMIGLVDDLAIININENRVVWSAGVQGASRAVLQEDGVLIVENARGQALWSSGEIPAGIENFDAKLVFWKTDEGMIAVQTSNDDSTKAPLNFWMDGAPDSIYSYKGAGNDIRFPVRGTFYNPTYNRTENSWVNDNGDLPHHTPSLGWYSSSDSDVVKAHVEGMAYANFDLGIASWYGPETNFDKSRLTMLLDETSGQKAGLKWTVSYEGERNDDRPSEETIRSDLQYLKEWFAWHDSWAHMEGKPVIFVNNIPGCDTAERWMRGAASDWFVVLRAFEGSQRCLYQPDSWYNRRANDRNDGVDVLPGLYFNLAPGEWKSGDRRPDLERLSPREWCDNVEDMMSSNEQWQLIVSFNDAMEGTSIEPSADWSSDSQYGSYLDCLHDPQMY